MNSGVERNDRIYIEDLRAERLRKGELRVGGEWRFLRRNALSKTE